MQMHHMVLMIVIALAFYYIGAKYPGMLAKIGM